MTKAQEAVKFARSKRGKAWLAHLSVSATRKQEYTFSDTCDVAGRSKSATESFLTTSLQTVTDHLAYKVGKAAHNMCIHPSERNATTLLKLAVLNSQYV